MTNNNKIIGKSAIGTRSDRSFRRTYYEDYPRGWRTYGIVTEFDPKTRKYLIEGQNYIYNEYGEFPINGTGDWYYRSQMVVTDVD